MTDDIFVNEDLSKVENRINVALFGLLGHDWLRDWLLSELDLPAEAVIYPPKNQEEVRPDFKIALNGTTLAWVEVEVGTDQAQVVRYRESLNEPVKTIWGRKADSADLSLEEIAEFMSKRCTASPALTSQVSVQIQHLIEQIEQALDGRSSYQSRNNVSEEMQRHPLFRGLAERLGTKLEPTTGKVSIGCLKADTNGPKGFSIRVNSTESASGTLSLMAISGGHPNVRFPSEVKLRKYLPAHGSQIDSYVSVIRRCGEDLGIYSEKKQGRLHYKYLLPEIDELVRCLLALAKLPNPDR